MANDPLPVVDCPAGTTVVGDLHLDVFDGPGPEDFARWLEGLDAPRLVILGDLFEFWAGRGQERAPEAARVVEALSRRVAAGTAIDVLHGNRDFLLGRDFRAATGAAVRPRGLVGRGPDGARTLFLHGDELCTDDRGYQRFRTVVRSGVVRLALQRGTPFALRRGLARRLRRGSRASIARKRPEEMAQRLEAAREHAAAQDARWIVCGHAHRFRDEDLGGGRRWLVIDGWGDERDALKLGDDGRWRPARAAGLAAAERTTEPD